MTDRGCGIICEYNPFHNGHKYQLEKAAEMSPFTVCVMSGDFVQRGEAAFQKKEVRAENAVKNGADVVLEIPFPFSSFGAEGFAKSGVEILEKSGLCETLLFGSECGDEKVLREIAECLCSEELAKKTAAVRHAERSLSYAAARQIALEKILGADYAEILKNPNDILGVEYIKAIIKTGSSIKPAALKRTTPRGGFDEKFASSGYIRNCFSDGREEDVFEKKFVPTNCSLEGIYENREVFQRLIQLSIMMKNPAELEKKLEFSKGLGFAAVNTAINAGNYEEMCSMLVNKNTTSAKARRMLLFGLFSVGKEVYDEEIRYTEILALSEKGRKAVKKFRERSEIIVASKIKDIKADKAAYEQYSRSRNAHEVLRKCCHTKKIEKSDC